MKNLIPRSRRAVALSVAASLAAVFSLAFLVTTYALPSQKAPPPTPNATALAQLTHIVGYYAGRTPEPTFTGELDGFQFRAFPSDFGLCTVDKHLRGIPSEHGSSLLGPSGLDFNATYVPGGFQSSNQRLQDSASSGHVVAFECGGDAGPVVVGVSEEWTSSSHSFSVLRQRVDPVIAAHYTKDQLQATTINGRPAITVKARFGGDPAAPAIYMRDGNSFWKIISDGLPMDQLLKVAQGLK